MADLKYQIRGVKPEDMKKWLEEHVQEYQDADEESKNYARDKWFRNNPVDPFPLVDDTATPSIPGMQPEYVEDEDDIQAAQLNTEEPARTRPKATIQALSPAQARVAALVDQASMTAPVLSNVKELFHIKQGAIPRVIVESRPENSYRWIDVNSIEDSLEAWGGIWVIVTRSNHRHLKDNLFGMDGSISYKASVILCFTNRDITREMEKRTIDALSLRIDRDVDNLSHDILTPGGKIVARVERVDDVGDGYAVQELPQGRGYDFADTGSD